MLRKAVSKAAHMAEVANGRQLAVNALASPLLSTAMRWQSNFGRGPAPSGPPRPSTAAGAPPPPRGIIDANGNVIKAKPAAPAASSPSRPGPAAKASPSSSPASPGAFIDPSTAVMDVDEASFMEAVIKCPVPVVLDVWADWCGPCKQLTPKLEGIARSAKGAIRLAKVNADQCRALTAQLQVKSLPTVFGIVGGKAVASFEGSVSDAELRSFFEQLLEAGEKMGAVSTPISKARDAVTAAHAMIDEGRTEEALGLLPQVVETLQTMRDNAERQLQGAADAGDQGAKTALVGANTSGPLFELDDLAARAIAGVVRCLCALATETTTTASSSATASEVTPKRDPKEMKEEVRGYVELLKGRYKHHAKQADVSRALAAADVLSAAAEHSGQLQPLLDAVAANPKDPQARYALAEAQLALGQSQQAVDSCLAIIKTDPAWKDGAAKSLLLKIFETLGATHPITISGRKALSKLLFR